MTGKLTFPTFPAGSRIHVASNPPIDGTLTNDTFFQDGKPFDIDTATGRVTGEKNKHHMTVWGSNGERHNITP